ncbi:transcriptional regulator, MarR family [Streptoalloteichus hindustanus]|uniref:Transcriptional regulator, MarR family n=1 Tax=Streptoalloteichus hindustanus TaxID=2017 RepID=A0A1M5J366_STRHI|nr:transcriptional regulator, MarR family [Streptoalloteichus hindustanus]
MGALRSHIDALRNICTVSKTGTARLPTRDELSAWRSFLRAHARITRRLEAELIAEQRLSLAAYDVLVQLAEAPEKRMRMTELADAVLLSRSGVTRLVDRLERIGLVCRERADEDGRGVVAVLTRRGLDRLRTASNTHLAGIVRHFVSAVGDEELDLLSRTCARLANGDIPEVPTRHADP